MLIGRIDELTEGDHHYITKDSNCYYFLEYPSGKGEQHYNNPNYSYIHNFKKSMDRQGTPQWRYKIDAIDKTISLFNEFISTGDIINKYTFIPIPPSKIRTDPMYDPRMSQVLEGIKSLHYNFDFREILTCKENKQPSHESNSRPTIQELFDNYTVNIDLLRNARKFIVLVDDVLTTGAHYCAARDALLSYRKDLDIRGMFIARRVLPNPIFDYFDDTKLPF
ncbi:hypothetical protein FKG96_09885 [Olivibacter sp. LS-1]|uniref:hypothetical protein n=1 Tax=Olivibacter sp. LS-1 TaxID=2592345 RepID=UPI0011EB8C41|nr:hypothetical protein [Olivibacter sp. LS-1]QEL01103.1 hypothetical protein FKG96_09885 [Olivibacter sp. LS-1]